MTSNTDDNGNAMFQSYLSKLFKKRNRLQIRSYRRYGEHGKKMFVFLGLYVHAAVRGGTCALTLKIVNTLVKTAHATIGLRSRHKSNQRQTRFVSGKAGESRKRTRRYQVDPWSRGREVARGVLRSSPKPERRPIFCHRRGIEIFCRLPFTQQRPNMFASDVWPAPATYHASFCEHCDQRVGRSP